MAKLKVFGGPNVVRGGKQVRTIVAATSQKDAARLVGVSINYLRDYWSVTGNSIELETALARPGVVFHSTDTLGKTFTAVAQDGA